MNDFLLSPIRLCELEILIQNSVRKVLNETSNQNQNQPEADKFLTIKETAEMLCLTVPTLYGFTQRSEIPFCKRGKRLYFSKREITEWIKQGRKKTNSEIFAEAENYLKK